MNIKMTHFDVWVAEIDDKAGGLAFRLRALADYGADLEYVNARPTPEQPGKGVVFVSSPDEKAMLANADQAGFRRATEKPLLKIEGTNEPGAGAKLTKAIADAGVSMNGLSANVIGHRFVCFAGFDSAQDRDKAETALKALAAHHWRLWPRREPKAA